MLPHARETCGELPVFVGSRKVVGVVVDGMQAEVETGLVGTLKLLAAILLIAYDGLQRAISHKE